MENRVKFDKSEVEFIKELVHCEVKIAIANIGYLTDGECSVSPCDICSLQESVTTLSELTEVAYQIDTQSDMSRTVFSSIEKLIKSEHDNLTNYLESCKFINGTVAEESLPAESIEYMKRLRKEIELSVSILSKIGGIE